MTRVDVWLGWLLTYAIHSTVLLGGVWLVARFKVHSPAAREVLWRTAMLAALLTATVQTAGWLPQMKEYRVAPPARAVIAMPDPGPVEVAAAVADVAAPTAVQEAARASGALGARPWSTWVVLGWAGVAVLLLLGFARRRAMLARRLGPRRILADHPMVDELDALAEAAGVRRRITLTVSDRLSSPIAVGVSEICVPAISLERLGADERSSMLAHELAHLVRFDPTWLLIGALLERVFFFQPLNRVARRALQRDAELLCDEWAASRVGSSVEMAKCLVKFAEWIDAAPRPVPVAGMAEERSHLLQRVERLLADSPRDGRRPLWLVAAVIGLVAGTAVVAPGVSLRGQGPSPADEGGEGRSVSVQDTSAAVVNGLTEALRDAHPGVRRAAANALGNLGARRAVPALLSASDDDNVDVRRAVVHALGEIRDRRAVDALVRRAGDGDREVREAAISALSDFGDAVSPAVFRSWLDDASPDIRAQAAGQLGERRDRAAVPRLMELTRDPVADVRAAAVRALGEIRAPEAGPAVAALLRDPKADVRQSALSALDELAPAELPAAVIELLGDADADVRHQAVHLVGRHRDSRGVSGLIRALDDDNEDVRRGAVEALGEIRTQPAIDALVVALKSKDPVVRKAAAEALGERHE